MPTYRVIVKTQDERTLVDKTVWSIYERLEDAISHETYLRNIRQAICDGMNVQITKVKGENDDKSEN